MTTPQIQPPADIGEMVERLRRILHKSEASKVAARIATDDLRALLTDRDDLVALIRDILTQVEECHDCINLSGNETLLARIAALKVLDGS